MVYEDIDGNGSRDIFSGEMGLAGWTVQLLWNGQVIASTTTLDDGSFSFPGLGNSAYEACVSAQTGYTQTQPVAGDGCGGSGYAFSFNSTIPATTVPLLFGMMLQ